MEAKESLDDADRKLAYCLHGLQHATLRLDAAHWHRPEDAFTAAAEAVSWVVALDAVLERSMQGDRDPKAYKDIRGLTDLGRVVIGMKFVRNHVHHAAELLEFVCLNAVVGNPGIGMRAGWNWAELGIVADRLDQRFVSGRGLYDTHLAGSLVQDTLLDANEWFMGLAKPLPPLPPDPTGAQRPTFTLPARWPPADGDRRQ